MSRQLAVRPLSEIAASARMPEAGRIRIGVKGAKGQPTAIDRMRFTSPHEDLIRQLAAIYGGNPKPWNDPMASTQNQWEVITTAKRVRVVLASDDCYSQDYEAWSKGGLLRRCDGETCQTTQDGPNGKEPVEVPCLCAQQGVLLCKLKTRLSVILPDVTFRGTWRLETSSTYAAVEIPGMVAVQRQIRRAGFTVAELGLEQRKIVRNGETKKFVVPTLTLMNTPEEIAAGSAALQGIPAASSSLPALPAASSSPAPSVGEDDDGILDAEIVDDRPLSDEEEALRVRCFAQADKFLVDQHALWQGVYAQAHDGKRPDLPLARIKAAVEAMEQDKLQPSGFADGLVVWLKR